MNYTIAGLTLATTNMSHMLNFYSKVFAVEFSEKEMQGHKLYSGLWAGIPLLLCPAELAQNNAQQNRHQFDLLVEDFDDFIAKLTDHGGQLMGEVQHDGEIKKVGVYDPDKNSMVIIQSQSK